MEGRQFVIGDLHGSYRALLDVFKKVKFDYNKDKLIFLGDILDGWEQHWECVELLSRIDGFTFVIGNHDLVFKHWLLTGTHYFGWEYGGEGVIKSYEKHLNKKFKYYIDNLGKKQSSILPSDIPHNHKDFFMSAVPYYIVDDKLFIHGSFDNNYSIKDYDESDIVWGSQLFFKALAKEEITFADKEINKVFHGHVNVNDYGYAKPFISENLINMDTGCGFKGCLTIMDINTMEYWQSEPSYKLYPNVKGRN